MATHGHFDHLLSLTDLQKVFPVPVFLHREDLEMPCDGEKNASALFLGTPLTFPADYRAIPEDGTPDFGELSFSVFHTPGHTAGSVVFFTEDLLFTGDTLFDGCVGRTDLYSGSAEKLKDSLTFLGSLPKNLTLFPGHGLTAPLGSAISQII